MGTNARYCSNCGKEVGFDANNCPECGAPVKKSKYCQQCGSELPAGTRICPTCGFVLNKSKYCQYCGKEIDEECIICPCCGKQISTVKQEQPQIIINNVNTNTNEANITADIFEDEKECDKWIAFLLCLFLGIFGAHKFYEERYGLAVLYLLTGGLCGIGAIVDLIAILCKPNPYYV